MGLPLGHLTRGEEERVWRLVEGVEGVEDLIVAGDEKAVREQLASIAATGTTDLCAFPFEVDSGSLDRTLELLGDVARSGR